MSGFEGLAALASSALEAGGSMAHAALFGVPEYAGAAATSGGLLTGGLSSLAPWLGLAGASGATRGNPQAGIPQLLASRALSTMPTSAVSAGPAVRTPDYSSMAGPYSIAPGMVDEMVSGAGGTPTPPVAGLPYNLGSMATAPPGTPTGPTPVPPIQQNSMAAAMGSGRDFYLNLRKVAAQEAEAKKPFAIAPTIRPGPPVPIAAGKPLTAGSPLQKYAMMLRRFG